MIVLKTTYDETERRTSPALLLKQELFQQLFDDRTTRIEWYGPLMDWHRHWSNETTVRTLYGLHQYRWPWLGFAVRQRRHLRSSGLIGPTNLSRQTVGCPMSCRAAR
jgi:hypothetical protein